MHKLTIVAIDDNRCTSCRCLLIWDKNLSISVYFYELTIYQKPSILAHTNLLLFVYDVNSQPCFSLLCDKGKRAFPDHNSWWETASNKLNYEDSSISRGDFFKGESLSEFDDRRMLKLFVDLLRGEKTTKLDVRLKFFKILPVVTFWVNLEDIYREISNILDF